MVDEYTRQCLTIRVARRIRADKCAPAASPRLFDRHRSFPAHPGAGNAPQGSPTRPRRPGLDRVGTRPPLHLARQPMGEQLRRKPQRQAAGRATQTAKSSPPPRKPRPSVEGWRQTHNQLRPHSPARVPPTPTPNHHAHTHIARDPPTNHNPKEEPHHSTNTNPRTNTRGRSPGSLQTQVEATRLFLFAARGPISPSHPWVSGSRRVVR